MKKQQQQQQKQKQRLNNINFLNPVSTFLSFYYCYLLVDWLNKHRDGPQSDGSCQQLPFIS